MASFRRFWQELVQELGAYAEAQWEGHGAAARRDIEAFLSRTRGDLERWTTLLASGALTREDFEWLVLGKRDVVELAALKRKGVGKAALDRFRAGLVELVVTAAFRAFL